MRLQKSWFVALVLCATVALIGCDDEESGGGDPTNADTSSSGADTSSSGADTSSSGADTSSSGTDTSSSGTDTSSSGTDTSSSGTDTDTTCTPTVTCETEGAECGEITNDCGDTVACAECGDGGQCNEATNQCEPLVCVPTVTCDPAAECGEITDDCGNTVPCGDGCGAGEACDNGTLLCVPDDAPRCGDGNLDAGEACDLGDGNNSNTAPDTCRTDCTLPRCGDSVTDTGEDCDDGNAVNNDACANTCGLATHCDACTDDADCGPNALCDAGYCAVPCEVGSADACPADFTCTDQGGPAYCLPDSGSCEPPPDPCDGVTCATPGGPECATNTSVRTYSAPGTCDGATGAPVCSYPSTVTACDAPPQPQCATNTSVRTFAAAGTCGGSPASCTYAPTVTPCDAPPLASCAGNTLTTYAATGTCSGSPASCTYGSTVTNCATTGQVCDATAGACVAPTPEVCDNGSDDDGDGDDDCADDDCATFPACVTFTVDYCRLQFPESVNDDSGEVVDTYGRLYIDGLTDNSPTVNTHPSVVVQFGFGPDGSDPAASPSGWTWADASPTPGWDGITAGAPDDDEYTYAWTLPAAGTYDYAYRVSGDRGATWTLCDLQPVGLPGGSANGYSPADAGQATVTASTNPPVVIASWSFEATTAADRPLADGGTPLNLGIQRIQREATIANTYPTGINAGTLCMSSNTWDNGANTKAWIATVNTAGYQDITLRSAYQISSATGPRDFQLQYSLDGATWDNVPSGTVLITSSTASDINNWSRLLDLPLPDVLDDQATIYLRWLVTSTVSVGGNAVGSNGTSRIDEVVIEGTPIP